MHILIAPNAFKNCLSATKVAEAIYEGLKQSSLSFTGECFPIGDGGDGTGELIIQKLKGKTVACEVSDPLGRKITSSFGLIDEGRTVVIEMADASGLRLLSANELNPLKASSYGTGKLMKAALDHGVKKIILCIGGSATVDGGCGILNALGAKFLNEAGNEIMPSPENLLGLASIDVTRLDERIYNCELIILSDVQNELLGQDGAATVFGPQKGASENDVVKLETMLENFASITLKQQGKDITNIPSGGAAGGVAAGLFGWLNAKLVNGINYFLDLTDFNSSLQKANLVITGEGSIDMQTLNGKGPFGVAERAKQKGMPVIGIAGKVPLEKNEGLQQYFEVLLSVGNEPSDLTSALKSSKRNIIRTSKEVGTLLALKS
ncbi:MAG TPA: glycerate kinase [Flavisolibacter sp.]|nr:glycerate kinase [Flavisolibacter sp.]